MISDENTLAHCITVMLSSKLCGAYFRCTILNVYARLWQNTLAYSITIGMSNKKFYRWRCRRENLLISWPKNRIFELIRFLSDDVAGNTNWRERHSTLDLLIKEACSVKKVNYVFNIKSSLSELDSARRPIVLSNPVSVRVPWTRVQSFFSDKLLSVAILPAC